MKIEEVYKLIGYKGKYDDKVKKSLKKLIKKYHPDRYGKNDIIKVIYEVKEELETNKVSFNNIDYDNKQNKENNQNKDNKENKKDLGNINDYIDSIKEEEIKKNVKIDELSKNSKKQNELFKEYSVLYNDYCSNEQLLCDNFDELKKVKKFSIVELICLFFILLTLLSVLIFDINYLIHFSWIFLIYLFDTWRRRLLITSACNKELSKINEKNKKIYDKMKTIKDQITDISDKSLELERELNRIGDNIRFYNNQIKKF